MQRRIFSLCLFTLSVLPVTAQIDSLSMLFIGNSYTYVNDLPGTLRSLALDRGKIVTTGEKTNGGFTFQNHVNDANTFTAIHSKPWDIVVLQGQSQESSFPYSQVNSATIPPAKQLADSVYSSNFCSNTMLYMTWGREVGDPQWDSINTFDKMNQRLYDANLRISDSIGSMVSPVAAVWKYIRDNYPSIQLYSSDGSHPSAAGTYLAACTFYCSAFQEAVSGANFLGGLDQTTAQLIQQAADQVVLSNLNVFHLHPVNQPTDVRILLSQVNQDVEVQAIGSHISSLAWDFGDGSTSVLANDTHIYTTPGQFTIQLVATSVCNSDTAFQVIQVVVIGVSELNSDLVQFSEQGESVSVLVKTDQLELVHIGFDGKVINRLVLSQGEEMSIPKAKGGGVILVLQNDEVLFRKKYMSY